MLSLLLAALVSTDPPFDVHRVAESAVCVPVSSTSVTPGDALDHFAFSLRWTTRGEVLDYPEYPEEFAELLGESVFAAFGESPMFRGLVLVTGEYPNWWPLHRQIAATAGRRFSLAGHQLANGATLTVYPDDGEFLLTAPQDARDEPEIGVLIVRGTCEFFWFEGDGTASAER